MIKLAIIIDKGHEYTILRKNGLYYVDFGGATGLSRAFEFKSDVKAITWFRKYYLHAMMAS